MAVPHKKTLTITGRGGGFGDVYLSLLSGIAFCEYKGYEYVHQPIKNLGHGLDAAEMNQFIGIPAGDYARADLSRRFIDEVHDAKRPDMYYTSAVLGKIRDFYYSTAKPAPCQYDIAIHIRRGDVQANDVYKFRRISNSKYRQILTKLKAEFPNYSIGIYSQGKIDDFAELQGENIHFCLNEDVQKTFHALVTAKVLVTAKSDFSYCAALLSTNTIYYLPYWRKSLLRWQRFEGDDIIGRLLFYARLKLRRWDLWWFRLRFQRLRRYNNLWKRLYLLYLRMLRMLGLRQL